MKSFLHARINFDLFKFNLKRNKGLLIVFTLLFSITFPAIILVNALSKSNQAINEFDIELFMILISLMMIFLLVLTPFIFFNYLNSKKSVDVYHSLSITRNDLFITFLALSLFFILLPLTVAYWGGFILTYLTTGIKFDPYHAFHFGRLLMVSIAVMAPSIFVIMNTGTLSDSLVYTGILIIAPFIAYGAYQLFAEINIIGFNMRPSSSLAYLSPLAGVFAIFENIMANVDGHMIASYWLLLGVGMNCVSMNLYNDWNSESSEVPFSNNTFFPFVTSIFIGILFVFLLSINVIPNPGWKFISVENLLIPILFTYALFLILNIIKFRSINTVKLATKNYLILLVFLMILTSTLHYSQGFGYSYRLPKEEDIISIEIEAQFQGEPFLSGQKLAIEESSTITETLNIHEQLIEYIKLEKNMFIEYAESDKIQDLNIYDVSGSYNYLTITYMLKDNEKFSRQYNIPIELQYIFFDLADNKELIYNNHPISNPKVNLINNFEVYDALFTEKLSFDFNLKDQDFIEAVRSDLLSLDVDSYYSSEDPVQMILNYYYKNKIYQLNIDSRFTETMKYLSPDRIISRQATSDVNYQIIKAKDAKNHWAGHGLSLLIQQDYYGLYVDYDNSIPDINLENLSMKIYDKRLSKESNDILIINTNFGQFAYPIIEE